MTVANSITLMKGVIFVSIRHQIDYLDQYFSHSVMAPPSLAIILLLFF